MGTEPERSRPLMRSWMPRDNVFAGDSSLPYLVEIPPAMGEPDQFGTLYLSRWPLPWMRPATCFATDGCGRGPRKFPAGCTSNSCAHYGGQRFDGPLDGGSIDALGQYLRRGPMATPGCSEVQPLAATHAEFWHGDGGNTSTRKPSRIQNIGNQALTFSSIGITLDSTDFKLASGTTNECSTYISAGAGRDLQRGGRVRAENTGSLSGTLTLVDNALNATSGAQAISLTCTGSTPAVSTTTVISSSPNPSFSMAPGNSVTFTATVTSNSTVNEGTVTFSDPANNFTCSGGNTVPVSNGQAACTTSFTAEGANTITATYSGFTDTYLPSSGSLDQEVDNHTVVTGNQYCNQGAVSVPSTMGEATPYPSKVFVSGFTGDISALTVQLNNISSSDIALTDLLLVGPTGSTIVPFANIGNNSTISGVNVTLSDSASSLLPSGTALTSGTFKPSAFTTGLSFPAPAPATFGYAAPTSNT